jgi:hypothetical protein
MQEWRKGYRAQGFYKNLAVNLLLGFFGLYMAVILLFLGFSLDELLEKTSDKLNSFELFSGSMLYLLIFGLAFRFFMQQLNTFNLTPYQVLPIKRSSIINFLLLRQLVSPMNYFLLMVVVPFAMQSAKGYYNTTIAVRFVMSFVLIVWFNSLFAAYLKRRFGASFFSIIVVIVVLAGVIALEYFNLFSLFEFSKYLFLRIVLHPLGLILPLLAVAAAFGLNKWFFAQNFYSESFNKKMMGAKIHNTELSFLDRYGIIGELIALELRLILRHKRTKSILYMSGFFLFYGLIFYGNPVYKNSNGMLFFVAMFVTGQLMFMYGQWILSWHSSHFDRLMTSNISIPTYFNANYYLLLSFNIICFTLTTPYFFFGEQIMYMHISAFIYNIGVNIYLLLYLTTYNTKRIDLSKTSAMNYQGASFKSFLIIMPIMFIPMILMAFISMVLSSTIALWTLCTLGTAGILLRKPLISLCVKQFNNRKYSLAEGFREAQ